MSQGYPPPGQPEYPPSEGSGYQPAGASGYPPMGGAAPGGAMPNGDPGTLALPWYGIGFGQAIKRWRQKFFVFTGRASRGEYWWVFLFQVIINIAIGIPLGLIGASTMDVEAAAAGSASFVSTGPTTVIGYLIGFALTVLTLGLMVRRLHDANFTGWLLLLGLIPCVGGFIMLILFAMPSKPEGARFDQAT